MQEWRLKSRLNRAYAAMVFEHEHSEDFINYRAEDKELNWQLHDEVIEGMTRLGIEWVPEPVAAEEFVDQELAADLYQHALQWYFVNSRIARFFSYRFFRQSELCFGWLSIFAERLRLMTFFYQAGSNLRDLSEFEPFSLIHSELYFQNPSNRLQPSEVMIFLALQQAFMEGEVMALFFRQLPEKHVLQKQVAKAIQHFGIQQVFFEKELKKTLQLFPEREKNLHESELPRLHFLEKFGNFQRLMRTAQKVEPGFLAAVHAKLKQRLESVNLPYLAVQTPRLEELQLTKEEQKVYARASAENLQTYRKSVSEIVDEAGVENDDLLRSSLRRMASHQSYRDHFNTGIYEYYLYEQSKIYWQLQDVKDFTAGETMHEVSSRDEELFDIVKEISYCEAATYTIGFSNMMHLGTLHPFALWNTQQCHEELKHFHTIRWVLNHIGVCTGDLDEHFLALENVVPTAEFFTNQYDVVMINFMGEIHNIRAYLMLADSMDHAPFKKVMRWIAEDEVLHKKVFAAFFNYMCQKDPKWERECYESLLDQGLHMHQAKVSPHYYTMMKKIGRFYSKANRTSALKFLNASMRAQYLELKSLFSEDVFTISEYDFRKKHLKAYAFEV